MDVYEEEAKNCGKSDSMSLVGSKELNVFMRGKSQSCRGGMHGSGETGNG